MKFAEIYRSNLKSVKEALSAMWCSESGSPAQKAYAKQLKELIDKKLFADESLYPVVQGMEFYKTAKGADYSSAITLVGPDLWKKTPAGSKGLGPYVHQYKCWDALLTRKESIVVTTGTGSGKTECFMVPLVRDLLDHLTPDSVGKIKAIFLYPLNALMEDQKTRIQALLANTGLRFAVYNGNLPERRDTDNSDEIDAEVNKYNRIVPTRDELHKSPPDILLTNPTMLEYMLLRDKDQKLFTNGSLSWIVVDEAHTFTGAGAAELAMLLRRVVNAFNVDPAKGLHFAASSATIGDGGDKELQRFISDISGVPLPKVKVISGGLKELPEELNPDILHCREVLRKYEFVRLDELIPGAGSVEEKLEALDEMCGRYPDDRRLRAKVHFFYRIPNNGIRVQLDNWLDQPNGILRLLDRTPDQQNATPALELKRCKHCGEYFATAIMSTSDDTYKACAEESSDVFGRMNQTQTKQDHLRIFGVVDKESNTKGNRFVKIDGNHCIVDDRPAFKQTLVANEQLCCPHCGASLVGKDTVSNLEDDNEDETVSVPVSEWQLKAESLRVSSDFISQTLAPALLSELEPHSPSDPHEGQQYLSFVDSRQAAARGTFKQNLEVERSWVYSRVFHKLCEEQAGRDALLQKLQTLNEKLREMDTDDDGFDDIVAERRALKERTQRQCTYMTWEEIFSYLYDDCKDESDAICKEFVSKESDDEFENGKINEAVKERYIFSIMIEQLSKYPPHSASAETMGLLESYYPSLSKAKTPDVFKKFNARCPHPIADSDLDVEWKNLLKIYIDRVARSNETIFMRLDNHLDSDIFNCGGRFGLKKPSRRVARLPLVYKAEGKLPIVHILLAKMLGADSSNMRDVLKRNKDEINIVIEAMWNSLVNETHLLQYSSRISSKDKIYRIGTTKSSGWINDKDTAKNIDWVKKKYNDDKTVLDKVLDPAGRQLRFNVAELAFKLPDSVHICEVLEGKKKHLRPATVLFCGHGAYYSGDDVSDPVDHEDWKASYPYIKGLDAGTGMSVTEEAILNWMKANRNVLFKYGLIGNDGCFSNRILKCLSYPDIFLQAEHTAQVNKKVSRASQLLFQKHKINILACSTTMEMGVDLGDLDLVMMSSIPPHPSNYRQRAGRSGRNTGSRSACITLCSSDIVGLRVLNDPIGTLIKRPMSTPAVDLDCPAIIQRHANAFLFRTSGKFFSDSSRSNLSLEIVDCFSSYHFDEVLNPVTGKHETDYWKLVDSNGLDVYPNTNSPMGTETDTRFKTFRDWLINDAKPSSLDFLLKDTCQEGKNLQMIATCLEEWNTRRKELEEELKQIGGDYEEAWTELKQDPDPQKSRFAKPRYLLETPYGNKLRWEYYHILRKNLIEYLATHRFTPNANMPVDVVEFNVITKPSPAWKKDYNNPSYQLRQALTQYAPGNYVVKENRVLKVAGVDFIGKNHNDKDPLITIYTDGTDVVTEYMRGQMNGQPATWPISGKNELQLVQAKAFIPDINEEVSRILGDSPYTHVSAQLVGAEHWDTPSGYPHLAALRASSHSGNSKILYYNEGLGFGYCLCGKCGKMVLEHQPGGKQDTLSKEMTFESMSLQDAQNTVENGHHAIDRKTDKGKPKFCRPNRNKYFRNVILGDLIQTDYCEIKLKEPGAFGWISSNHSYKPLLTTLGILICKVFTEYMGKERQYVDFLLMPTGSLCIFDTNPGGSGYSNKLADPYTFREVIKRIRGFLATTTSKDALLDKFTLKYLNDIDIEKARAWIDAELKTWRDLPQSINNTGIDCHWSTYTEVVKSLDDPSVTKCRLFISDNWDKWNYKIENEFYDSEEDTWKVRMDLMRRVLVNNSVSADVVIIPESGEALPAKLFDTAIEMKGWLNGEFKSTVNVMPAGLYPVAVVGDKLFFTDDLSCIEVDSQWGRGSIFVTELRSVTDFRYDDIDLKHRPGSHAEFKLPMSSAYQMDGKIYDLERIQSNTLFEIVSAFSKTNGVDLVAFISSMANLPERLEIVYQDEHMKSGHGILVAMQFIRSVIELAGKCNNFSLKFLNEQFYDFKGTDSYPFKGMSGHAIRNMVIDRLASEMYTAIGADLNVCPLDVDSRPFNDLTHWRVLTIKCGRKQVSIYPNGGFVNEWIFDKQTHYKFYDNNDDLCIDDMMPLFRRKEIKYEIIIDNE